MRAAGAIARAAFILTALFCLSCHRELLMTGPVPAAQDITNIRRGFFFLFPRDRNQDMLYNLAAASGSSCPADLLTANLSTEPERLFVFF